MLMAFAALMCAVPAQAQPAAIDQAHAAWASGDFASAARLYLPLARAGNADAQFRLAEMTDEGEGVQEDERAALKWYQLAAGQGHADAQATLGAFYAMGRGVEQDYAQAVQWDRLAAAQGNAKAQFNLGWMYEMGYGVDKDPVRSYLWTRRALAHAEARQKAVYQRSVDALLLQLSEGQLRQAQELEKQ